MTQRNLLLLSWLFLSPAILAAQPERPEFSTLLGGSGQENLRDVAIDRFGNVYVTGGTSSPDYPTTPNAYDRTFATGGSSLGNGGPMDAFVAKYTSDGRLLWSTLLGGPNYDRAYAIEVDFDGNVYVGGRAGDDFPTTEGVLQEEFAGDVAPNGLYGKQDAFVAKLSPGGDSLIWATYFGGDGLGFARDIDIDPTGAVYLAFSGSDRPVPHVTPGAYQTESGGARELVVAKISPDASQVVWATYYGGSGDDGLGPSIRVHSDATVTVTGTTKSQDLPRAGARSSVPYGGGSGDMFVARFSADGSRLIYGTYFGGSANDGTETHTLALDDDGNAWITGFTTSPDLPVTTGVFQPTQRGSIGSIPIAHFAADDGKLLRCSYLGGSTGQGAQGIAVGRDGNVIVGGATSSIDYPVTPNAAQSEPGGERDMIVTVAAPDLSRIIWSTRFGGSGEDDGRTLQADRSGTIVLAGHTDSPDFPLVAEAQSTYGGGRNDGTITRFTPPYDYREPSRLTFGVDCWTMVEGGSDGFLTIRRSPVTDSALTIRLTVTGTAASGLDYRLDNLTLTIAANSQGTLARVINLDDNLPEEIEVIELTPQVIAGPGRFDSGAVARFYIVDDDTPTPNLLGDPDFEDETTAWQKTTNGGRSIVDDTAQSGSRSLRIVGSRQYVREVFQDVPVTPGALYLSKLHARYVEMEGGQLVAEIIWLDANEEELGRLPLLTIFPGSTEQWGYAASCATPPERATTARYRLFLPTEPDDNGRIWFDNVGFYRADGTVGIEGEGGLLPKWLDLR